jgi:electron transfer flavoprotein alpha subunit
LANILVYIELVDDEASWASLLALRQARYLASSVGATIYAVLPCATPPLYGENDIIAILSRQGADKVILMTHKALSPPLLFQSHGEALLTAANQFPPALLLVPSGPAAVEIAARVAARLGGLFVRHPRISVQESSTLRIDQPLFEDTHVRRFDTAELEHSVVAVVSPDPQQFSRALGSEEAEVVVISPGFDEETSAPRITPAENHQSSPRSQRTVLVGAGITTAAEVDAIGRLAKTIKAELRVTQNAAELGILKAAPLDEPALVCRPEFVLAFGVHGSAQTLAQLPKNTYLVGVNPDKKAPIFQRTQLGLVSTALEAAQQMVASAEAHPGGPVLPVAKEELAEPPPQDGDEDKGESVRDTLPTGTKAHAGQASTPTQEMGATPPESRVQEYRSPAIDQLAHTPPMGTPLSAELQSLLDAAASASEPTDAATGVDQGASSSSPVPTESASAQTPEASPAGAVDEAHDPALDDTVPAPMPGGGEKSLAKPLSEEDAEGKPKP